MQKLNCLALGKWYNPEFFFFVCVCVCVTQSLQEEMDKQESNLRKFGSVTHQLLTECHPSVAETLNRALRDVNIR